MQLMELIKTRRTIHDYTNEPIPESLVEEAIELAFWSPNHKLTQPWNFVLVGPVLRRELAEISVKLKEESKGHELSELIKKSLRDKITTPSHLLVLLQPATKDIIRKREDYASIACGVQSISLFLTEKGYGSKWSSGQLTRHPLTYDLLKVNAAEFEIVGFVWMGRPAKIPPAPARPVLRERLTRLP